MVPAYNEEVTVVETVKSLLQLDYRSYEIIVVDDGSRDETAKKVIDAFSMHRVSRPIRRQIECQPEEFVFETCDTRVPLTVIRKKNGGKADALNMGINAANYPYFICMDADSVLQYDSLKNISQPILEKPNVVAVGGLIRLSNDVELESCRVKKYQLPKNIIACMQVLEYDRSFLASRIMFDKFNGSLIISGAFGLFKKDVVIAAGGYNNKTMGEDMELVVKLHEYCTVNNMKYTKMLFNPKFGAVAYISYLYFLIYELLSPFIEIFGVLTMLLAFATDLINIPFMVLFFLIYAVFGSVLSLTAFFSRIYTSDLKVTFSDAVKACLLCVFEITCLRFVLAWVRATAFFGYRKKKLQWGRIERKKINFK